MCVSFSKLSVLFLDLSEVKRALELELQKCNSSCKESLENYVANMSTNADFQQVSLANYGNYSKRNAIWHIAI